MSSLKHHILDINKTMFFLCDMQEKFKPAIFKFNEILVVCKRLVEASAILNIPLVVTEQYPKGLGSTVAELNINHAIGKFEKTKFSMFIPEIKALLHTHSIETVVLFGIESHVCIQQTALDLLSNGISVHLIADACSSRSKTDRLYAFERLRQAGIVVTTHESCLLQLIGDKDHPKFKDVQTLIKSEPIDTGLTI